MRKTEKKTHSSLAVCAGEARMGITQRYSLRELFNFQAHDGVLSKVGLFDLFRFVRFSPTPVLFVFFH